MTTSELEIRAYSRPEMRAWLATLPPDEPFCGQCRCPISEFMTRMGWVDWLQFDNAAAENRDPALAVAIDKFTRHRRDPARPGFWSLLTAGDVITIIDELQERFA